MPKWDELLKCKCDIDATLQELMDNRLVWNEARPCFVQERDKNLGGNSLFRSEERIATETRLKGRAASEIAKIKSADQMALEAGNSPSIIFKHYRELATEKQADKWCSIEPKDGQLENAFKWDRRARVITLPGSAEK